MTRRNGFTLIELLVVLAVMATLAAMTVGLFGVSSRPQIVQSEAERLARTLQQVRAMAMTRRQEYGVAFNLQNPAGSSGRVLSNHDGGHWYRVLGPAYLGFQYHMQARVPHPERFRTEIDDLGHLMQLVDQHWYGDALVLPARQVRFLALGDTDEGNRHGFESMRQTTPPTRTPPIGYAPTYPRPYFGWYDDRPTSPTRGRLFAWGGYEGDAAAWTFTDPYRGGPPVAFSGFYYGADGGVSGCVNTSTRSFDNWVDTNLDWTAQPSERVTRTVFTQDEPRPLVNAAWLDAIIIFAPDGTAQFQTWNAARRMWKNAPPVQPGSTDPYLPSLQGWWPGRINPKAAIGSQSNAIPTGYTRARRHGGVRDLCKHYEATGFYDGIEDLAVPTSSSAGSAPKFLSSVTTADSDTAEVGHFVLHTGAWRLTLAPDLEPEQDTFPTVTDALRALNPLWRVEITRQGGVRTYRVSNDGQAIQSRTLWPPAPTDWQDDALINQHCRLGWWHRPNPVDNFATATNHPALAGRFATIAPRGSPITDVLTAPMLTQRQWWME